MTQGRTCWCKVEYVEGRLKNWNITIRKTCSDDEAQSNVAINIDYKMLNCVTTMNPALTSLHQSEIPLLLESGRNQYMVKLLKKITNY